MPDGTGRRGRDRDRRFPKGRSLEPQALAQVQSLLGDAPRRRDELIEYLHLIQDAYGALAHRHLMALAHEMRLAPAEVYEVASFYAHFDLLPDDAGPAPEVTVRVCDGIACAMHGAAALHHHLVADAPSSVRVVRAPCMGRCEVAPTVEVGHRHVDRAHASAVAAAITAGATTPVLPPAVDFDAYCRDGGYTLVRRLRVGQLAADAVIAEIAAANLRGLGGAGFPTARKMEIVRRQPAPRILAVNADEGEPGTIKDRFFLESDPHRVLEGMLLAAILVGAETCYIYVRDEYPAAIALLRREIERLRTSGLLEGLAVAVRRGAGAYICGEESAMLESLEGKRGLPRHKPPYPAEVGLFGRPTLTHNVETLYWLRAIVERGGAWFADQGRNGRQGLRSFSVSGRVRRPGVKIAPAGITLRQLVDEFCGGMADGHHLKAYLPGGASGGILPAHLADEPLDFGTLEPHGCFIGSAAIVVFSDHDNMADVAHNLMAFFADESCGQCTPCRLGTEKALALLQPGRWDAPLLHDLGQVMRDASICGLGQAAPNPVDCVLKYFPEDVACAGQSRWGLAPRPDGEGDHP